MPVDARRRAAIGALAAMALGGGPLAASVGLAGVPARAGAQPAERVIRIVARKFEYEPRSIRVKKGEPVRLEFSAPEVPMGFNLHDFGLRIDITPGQTATLRLTPERAGEFVFYCDVFCGSGHEEMDGTLVVTE